MTAPAPAETRLPPHFEFPWWIWLPAGVLLAGLTGLFLAGLVDTLQSSVGEDARRNLPLAGWQLLTLNSVCFSLLAAEVSLGLALMPAVALRHAGHRRVFWLALAAAAAAIPWIVTATGWTQTPLLFGAAGNRLDGWLKQPLPGQDTIRLFLAAATQGAMGAPLAFLLLSAFLPPPAPEEEAALLAGTRWQVFRMVFLPLAQWPILTVFAVMLLWQFNDFTMCDLWRVPTWSTRVFTTTAGLSATLALREYLWMALFNAGGFVLLAIALTRLTRRRAAERTDWELPVAAALRPGPLWRYGGGVLLVGLSQVWPFTALLVRLGQSPDATGRSVWTGLQAAFHPWVEGLQVSFATGCLTAVLGLGLGTLLVSRGWFLRRLAWLSLGLLLSLAAIGIVLPLKAVQQRFHGVGDLSGTHFFEIGACLLRALPWCMLLTAWQLYQLPRNFDEAARADGANRSQVFTALIWPQLLPLLPVTFFIGFALAGLDLAPAVMLSPPGRQPLLVRLFDELHYDYNANLIVMALFIAAPFPLLAAPLAGWFARRRPRSGATGESSP